MRLVARRDTSARVLGRTLRMGAGEAIRTELSCKYTRDSFERRLAGTAFGIESWYPDAEELFAVALLRRA